VAAPTDGGGQSKSRSGGGEHLGEDAELARATGLYDTGQYEACVDAFDHLLDPEEPRRLRSSAKIEMARTYHGACLIGVGRTTDAERVFRDAILENPQMKAPDGLLFPEAVVELFLRVRESMLDEIRRAEQKRMQDAEARANREQQLRALERQRVEQLVAIAEKESVVEIHSRWIASVPFGVGQFQNGNAGLGWFFLVGETAMAGLLAGSIYAQAYYLAAEARRPELSDAPIHATRTLQTIGGYGLLGLGILGIAEAHLSFVPEVRLERKRDLPEQLRLPKTSPPPQPPVLSLSIVPWATHDSTGAAVVGAF
jgi:tetratricopeptide (TPR) repeat protein